MAQHAFTCGIVWDPREPLPPEFQRSQSGLEDFERIESPQGERWAGSASKTGNLRPIATTPWNPPPAPPHIGAWPLTHVPRVKKPIADTVMKGSDRNLLPPMSISVESRIVEDTARVTFTQQFWNNADLPIMKALYTFPLPNGCTVTEFSCRIGRGEIMNAIVMPRQEAQEAFNDAIVRGASTALLEQDTPEIFTSSLGNIPPNTRLKTKITFLTLLRHRFDNERKITTFTIPTCIAGRYGEAPQEFQGATSTDVRKGLSIQVEVLASDHIKKVESRTHDILVDRVSTSQAAENFEDLADETPKSTTSITLVRLKDGSTFLDRDFVLDIETFLQDGLEQPKAWLETHPTLANHQALMVTIPPIFFMRDTQNESDGEILFLADRSGSMVDKIDTLKSALRFFVKGIPLGKKFNIWSFGSSYKSIWPQSADYIEENVRQALEAIDAFDSNMGGTELLAALDAIILSRDASNPCDIIVLTDGEVWRLDQTLDLVQRTRTYSQGLVRFFSLGIGCAVSHALVEGIAKSGGGYSEVISSANQGGWEDRAVAMLKAALTRHVGSLEVDIKSQYKPYGESMSPADLGFLNPFQNNRVFVLFDDSTTLNERGFIEIKSRTADGSDISEKVLIHTIEKEDTTLHGLGSRAILEDLEGGRSKIHLSAARPQHGSYEEQRLIRTEAEAIACKYSIASKWTSFFLVGFESETNRNFSAIANITHVKRPRSSRHVGNSIRRRARGSTDICHTDHLPYGGLISYGPPPPRDDMEDTADVNGPIDRARKTSTRAQVVASISQPNVREQTVRNLLTLQRFDGSFDIKDEEAEGVVGKEVARAICSATKKVQTLVNEGLRMWRTTAAVDRRLAATAMILLFLEKDFQECKDLWELMRSKGMAYIKSHLPTDLDETTFFSKLEEDEAEDGGVDITKVIFKPRKRRRYY
ncbi:hypothetical protein DL764_008420 [Monosporascus ibericus]|uniref:VIT domain-containing protein n=1 Tax=Monosporascus ibericus TaxID=155417 RepID=A0A4Q4SXJ4_9PEZI|nr:hypothetical protein DL764_008420 [Monosporascus ibericus]